MSAIAFSPLASMNHSVLPVGSTVHTTATHWEVVMVRRKSEVGQERRAMNHLWHKAHTSEEDVGDVMDNLRRGKIDWPTRRMLAH